MERKGKGRRKISMKKIENENHMQVTFSKRRAGLFKKASELCILCDAEVALIVFSPGNKVYSFGHPSVAVTVNKYLTNDIINTNFVDFMLGAGRNLSLQELTREINNLEENLTKEKAKATELNNLKKAREGQYLWNGRDKDQLTLKQLELLKAKMEQLSNNVKIGKHKISFEANNYVRGDINATPTSIGPYDGMGYVHTEGNIYYDPKVLGPVNGYTMPYDHKLVNELDCGIPNLFAHNGPSTGDNPSFLVARTLEHNYADVNGNVGPTGTNTYYGSTNNC